MKPKYVHKLKDRMWCVGFTTLQWQCLGNKKMITAIVASTSMFTGSAGSSKSTKIDINQSLRPATKSRTLMVLKANFYHPTNGRVPLRSKKSPAGCLQTHGLLPQTDGVGNELQRLNGSRPMGPGPGAGCKQVGLIGLRQKGTQQESESELGPRRWQVETAETTKHKHFVGWHCIESMSLSFPVMRRTSMWPSAMLAIPTPAFASSFKDLQITSASSIKTGVGNCPILGILDI